MWPNPDTSLLFFGFLGGGGDGGGTQLEHGADGERRRGALTRHQCLTVVKMALVTEELEGGGGGGEEHRPTIFGGIQNRRRKMLARLERGGRRGKWRRIKVNERKQA